MATITLHTTTECQAAYALTQRMWATFHLLSPSDVEFYHQLIEAIETFKNKTT